MERFYIDKSTGTFADELMAAGFARCLMRVGKVVNGRKPEVVQVDRGTYYELECEPAIDREALAAFAGFVACAPIIRTAKNGKKLPADLPIGSDVVVDYEGEKAQRGAYLEAYKALPKTAKRADARGESDLALEGLPAAPHPDWDIFRAINPASLTGYNGLMVQWYLARSVAGEVMGLLFEMFGQTPNPVVQVRGAWRKVAKANKWKLVDASASQLLNPSQGKGINKSKANSASLGNLKNFWLLEWLKAVGLYELGFTRTLQGSNDRKTYVLAPKRLAWRTHEDVVGDFRRRMRFAETAIRSDILTVIRYVRAFVGYVEAAQQGRVANRPSWWREEAIRPADVVHGFHVAYYKDMGNAVVMMNLAFLNLPDWVAIKDADDVVSYQAILKEHEEVVRQLREDRGEEIELLSLYRDFVVADNLEPFFRFTTAYSGYIISQREKRSGFAYQFSVPNLRRLLMSSRDEPRYSEIFDNRGFQNVAYAIRQSTVVAQYRRKQKNDRRYNVRYGLGQELTRQSQYKKEFIAALSDFMHKYNAENAQVMETRKKPYRRSLLMSDVQEVIALIDEFGSDLICKMLVAFGYARTGNSGDGEA